MGLSVDLHVRESPIHGALQCSPAVNGGAAIHFPNHLFLKIVGRLSLGIGNSPDLSVQELTPNCTRGLAPPHQFHDPLYRQRLHHTTVTGHRCGHEERVENRFFGRFDSGLEEGRHERVGQIFDR